MRRASDGATAGEGPPGNPDDRPDQSGGLEELLGLRPVFRVRTRGYDRHQVDNYAAWAETELLTVRREVEHLLNRVVACSAELAISRRAVDAPRAEEPPDVSDRASEMLRLASEEAAALTDAAADEADRILAEARMEAEARLQKARAIREMAVEAADEICARAHREAGEILRAAAEERDRAAEAAAARLAVVQAEVDDLRRQRDEARHSLRQLTDQIGQALQAVLTTVPDEMVVLAGRQPVPS